MTLWKFREMVAVRPVFGHRHRDSRVGRLEPKQPVLGDDEHHLLHRHDHVDQHFSYPASHAAVAVGGPVRTAGTATSLAQPRTRPAVATRWAHRHILPRCSPWQS